MDDSEDNVSVRSIERHEEDEQFIPVIVKRTDEARRHPDDILEHAINEGLRQHQRKSFSLFLSSVAAGLILGFTAMAVAVVLTTIIELKLPQSSERVLTAIFYPLGFIVCIMSGTQLFTEHTATAFYPTLDGKSTVLSLFRVWGIVIIGNIFGAIISALLLAANEDIIQAHLGYTSIAEHIVGVPFSSLLLSALLAGWLMAQGAWLVLATPPTISQMASIYLVTFLIGLGGLHHSIAGAVEMFAAYLVTDLFTLNQSFRFVGIALLGNLIGGGLFVAMLNYSHVRQTQIISKE